MQAIIDFFSNMFIAISMWSSAKNAANIFVNETMVAQAYERIELLSEYMQWNKEIRKKKYANKIRWWRKTRAIE